MASNLKYHDARILTGIAATDPATPTSGDPVVFGQIPGVALTDEGAGGNGAGLISMDTEGGYEMSVTGADGSGNAAITAGDIIYLDSGVLNVDDTNGVRWGYALEDVASGATSDIKVKVGY